MPFFWGPLRPAFGAIRYITGGLGRGYPRDTLHWGFLEDRLTSISLVLA